MSLWDKTTVNALPTDIEISWLHQDRIPMGAVSMLGGIGGVGKSIYVAGLEVAVASGKPFLDAEVTQGPVLHFDFDTDARLQGPWYRRVAKGMNAPSSALSLIDYFSPGEGDRDKKASPYLDSERLDSLPKLIEHHQPVLVVFDAWTSCFPYIRSNDAGEVAQVMALMRSIAKLGPAVIILDHTPKPVANGPAAIERGLLGSTLKMAGARSVDLLSRVPPKDVEGRDVLRLDTVKNNLAPIGEPLGIERLWWDDGSVSFSVCDLPESEARAPALERAMRYLRDNVENPMARKALLPALVQYANVSERTAISALNRLVATGELEKSVQGREATYTPVARLHTSYTPVARLHTSEKSDGKGQEKVQEGLHGSVDFAQVSDDPESVMGSSEGEL